MVTYALVVKIHVMVRQIPRSRRHVLTALGSTVIAALAGCQSTHSTQPPATETTTTHSTVGFDGWFDNVPNYTGVTDATDKSTVTVTVGADGNNSLAFAPAAIKITAGTTVVWKWTGNGGSHNVIATDGAFQSQLTSEHGHTFSYTFSNTGTYKYYCEPHKTMGMKGVVLVE